MENFIRKALISDLEPIIALLEQKRLEYEAYQPVFWRKADDSAQKQSLYFEKLLQHEKVIAFVHEQSGIINGVIVGTPAANPPVYNPGGATYLIDDFTVASPELWQTIGLALLQELTVAAKACDAVQLVVVCSQQDEAKRTMLEAANFPVVTEWRVKAI